MCIRSISWIGKCVRQISPLFYTPPPAECIGITLFPLIIPFLQDGYCFGAQKVGNSTPLEKGTILVPPRGNHVIMYAHGL